MKNGDFMGFHTEKWWFDVIWWWGFRQELKQQTYNVMAPPSYKLIYKPQ